MKRIVKLLSAAVAFCVAATILSPGVVAEAAEDPTPSNAFIVEAEDLIDELPFEMYYANHGKANQEDAVQVKESENASGGKYLWLRGTSSGASGLTGDDKDGDGTPDEPDHSLYPSGSSVQKTVPKADAYEIRLEKTCESGTQLYVWVRVAFGTTATSQKFYYSINKAGYENNFVFTGSGTTNFQWLQVPVAAEDTAGGKLTVDLYHYHQRLCVDKIIITEDATFAPTDKDSLPADAPTSGGGSSEAETPAFTNASLSLNGNIGVNFYMSLPEAVVTDEDAKVVFTLLNEELKTVMVSDATPETIGGKELYKFSCEVSAKQMTDTITATFYNDDTAGDILEYSVKAYADTVLGDTTGTYDSAKPLVKAMLNYGAYSQTHFDYNIETLANADLAEGDKALSEVTATDLTAYAPGGTANAAVGAFEDAYLSLESETKVNVRVKLAENVTGAQFKIGEQAVACTEDTDGYYVLSVDRIKPSSLDEMYTFTVTAGEQTATLTYGALSYAYTVLNGNYTGEDAATLTNVVKALYEFNVAANAYAGQ